MESDTFGASTLLKEDIAMVGLLFCLEAWKIHIRNSSFHCTGWNKASWRVEGTKPNALCECRLNVLCAGNNCFGPITKPTFFPMSKAAVSLFTEEICCFCFHPESLGRPNTSPGTEEGGLVHLGFHTVFAIQIGSYFAVVSLSHPLPSIPFYCYSPGTRPLIYLL